MGNEKAAGDADITIASVASLTSRDRILKFDPSRFKLILVDEAHHIVAPSYRKVLNYFGLNNEPSLDSPVLVGVSATLSRFDGLKLGSAIDHIVYHKDYMDMIDEEWLANAVFTTVRSHANLSGVKKDNFGDFAIGSLSQAVNTQLTNDITVRAWLANAQNRKSTLVFCVDIEHTKRLTEAFRAAGIDARYITSRTEKQVRDEELQRFKNREFPILLNCGLFTEGTDVPNIDCVLLARPTRSRNLLIQMIGRGLRLYPGKKDCHIIDMVATLDTGVICTPTLFGLHPDEVLNNESPKDLKDRKNFEASDAPIEAQETSEPNTDSFNPADHIDLTFTKYDTIYDLVHDMRHERHIRSISPYSWVRVGKDRYLLSDVSGWATIEKVHHPDDKYGKASPPWEIYHVMHFNSPDSGKTQYTRPRFIGNAEDFVSAVRAADTFATSEFSRHYISTKQPWRQSRASQMQVNLLNRYGIRQEKIKTTDNLTRGQAADLITKLRHGVKKQYQDVRKARQKEIKDEEKKKDQISQLLDRTTVRVGPVAR